MKNDTLLVALAFIIVILCLLVCVVALWQPPASILPSFAPSTSAPTVEQTQASTPPVPEPTEPVSTVPTTTASEETTSAKKLIRIILVRLAKHEIDNGKVYIDIEALRTLLSQEVCELFERYLEYKKINLNEYIFAILNSVSNASADPVCVVNPRKKTNMLEDIVKKSRDIFTADNKYGLHSKNSIYLSCDNDVFKVDIQTEFGGVEH